MLINAPNAKKSVSLQFKSTRNHLFTALLNHFMPTYPFLTVHPNQFLFHALKTIQPLIHQRFEMNDLYLDEYLKQNLAYIDKRFFLLSKLYHDHDHIFYKILQMIS